MITIEQRNAKLDEAKALVLAGWTQRALARDAGGFSVEYERPIAVSFCAMGACFRVDDTITSGLSFVMHRALQDALISLGFDRMVGPYNDAPERTKYEVAALFDHAKGMPL